MNTDKDVLPALVNSAILVTKNQMYVEILQEIMENARLALNVQAVSLAMVDEETNQLEFQSSSNIQKHSLAGVKINTQHEPYRSALSLGKGNILQDSVSDAKILKRIEHIPGLQIFSIACVPITWQNETIGIIEATNPLDKAFNNQTLELLRGFGSMAVTAIQTAELTKTLQSIRKHYQDMFESGIDAILISNLGGQIIESNHQAQFLIETTKEGLQNFKIKDLCLDYEEVLGKDFSALRLNETASFETNITTHKNKNKPVQVFARMVLINAIPHIQWTIRDISERKHTEALRNDLITMIYHDLRSPLANIVSSLDVLATLLPLENEKALKSLLNIAIRSAERIQRLTNSLLDMRKFEAGQAVTNPQRISPEVLSREAFESIQTVADAKRQKLHINIKRNVPNVWVDADMVRRVLINLLENAIKYTPQNSNITIGAVNKNDWVEMYVQDNGPGIPLAEQEHIFEKFTRLQEDTSRGFGLGLAYCRLAVEANGGKIWVESNSPTGACFKFTLPRLKTK